MNPHPESNTEPPVPTTTRARSDGFRGGLRRANTAVAVVIGIVLALALAALWQGRRAESAHTIAEQQRLRAQQAEVAARQDLQRALLAEARATRLGATITRREVSLDSIRRAAAILPTKELRDEAIATLALPEYRLESTIPLDGTVRRTAFDFELRHCAIALSSGEVVLRRVADGTEVRRLTRALGKVPDEQGAPATLTFAPGGGALAVRYSRGAIAVFDLETGTGRFVRDADRTRGQLSAPSFSTDGRHLLSPVFTPNGFEVMDALTGATVAHFPEFRAHHHGVMRPGTNHFAVFTDGKAHVINWKTRQTVAQFAFPGARQMSWSRDGRQLAIVGNGRRAVVWDVDSNRSKELPGHKADLYDVQFDVDGERLMTKGFDSVTRLWDLRDARVLAVSHDRGLTRWGPDRATGWGISRERLELRREPADPVCRSLAGVPEECDGGTMDISADGRWAATVAETNLLLLWNLHDSRAPLHQPVTNVSSFCFHPTEPVLLGMYDRALNTQALSVRTNDSRANPSLEPPVLRTTIPERGADLVTTSADGSVRAYVNLYTGGIWLERPGATPALVQVEGMRHHSSAWQSSSTRGSGTLAFSPDGRWLAVGTCDGGATIVDVRIGRKERTLSEDIGFVQFSPDGRWVMLTTGITCKVFRASDWSEVWSRSTNPSFRSYSGAAAFSPDGNRLACALHPWRVTLFATEDGRELGVLESPDAATVTQARWTGDGSRLVLATRDNRINVWDLPALERELDTLGLGWNLPVAATVAAGSLPAPGRGPGRWDVTALLAGAVAAAGVALLALRRHRRLVDVFAETESLALQRETELQVERKLHDLKSQFVSTVSHEFRTPLGVIMSSAENLRDYFDRLKPVQRGEHLEDIINAARTMSGLMEEVLLLGRVESGKVTFRPEPLDLHAFCVRAIEDVQSATSHRCLIELHLAPGERPARGDEGLLRHILVNLLNNAVKYSPHGRAVELRVTPDEAFAVFTIRDHGIGIPAEDLPHLFDAFHRGRNVGDIPGSGLGMVIVKRCVEMHGGTITCDSRLNEGTTFAVRLPIYPRL